MTDGVQPYQAIESEADEDASPDQAESVDPGASA